MIRVCLTGAESTGKSTLAPRLARCFGAAVVPEYGRHYAEVHGTRFTPGDLRRIARGHIRLRVAIETATPGPIIEDTDIVTTAAWAQMLFGAPDPELEAIPASADLYLLFDPDVPWVEDGTRLFGSNLQRDAFDRAIGESLARRGIVPVTIGGDWDARFVRAKAAIERHVGLRGSATDR